MSFWNFYTVNSSEVERKYNRIKEAKLDNDSDNEDEISYLKNKYQENSRTNYKAIDLSKTTSYNFDSSSESNKNSLAKNKNQIESSSENQKYLGNIFRNILININILSLNSNS